MSLIFTDKLLLCISTVFIGGKANKHRKPFNFRFLTAILSLKIAFEIHPTPFCLLIC
jgi:hypothetical protein